MGKVQFGVIGVLLALLVSGNAYAVLKPSNTTMLGPPKWDYKIGSVPDLEFGTQMTTLGEEGWELVFARRASNGESGERMSMSYECIFKRPK